MDARGWEELQRARLAQATTRRRKSFRPPPVARAGSSRCGGPHPAADTQRVLRTDEAHGDLAIVGPRPEITRWHDMGVLDRFVLHAGQAYGRRVRSWKIQARRCVPATRGSSARTHGNSGGQRTATRDSDRLGERSADPRLSGEEGVSSPTHPACGDRAKRTRVALRLDGAPRGKRTGTTNRPHPRRWHAALRRRRTQRFGSRSLVCGFRWGSQRRAAARLPPAPRLPGTARQVCLA
jgi:hypothetical protein